MKKKVFSALEELVQGSLVNGQPSSPLGICLKFHFFFPEVCSVCTHPILEQYFLVLESRPYHSHCLRCALCHCGLSYETTCYVKNGLVLCRKDYTEKFRRSCAKCHVALECDDIVMRARDAVFHVHCFSCAVCGIQPNVGDIFALTTNFEILCQVHYDLPQLEEPNPLQQTIKIRKDDSDEPEEVNYVLYDSNGSIVSPDLIRFCADLE
ncbi:LIM domain protein, partial [Necator americanus]